MKKRVSLLGLTSLLVLMAIPSLANAGNVKKTYINVAKEGNQATTNDLGNIASYYGQIPSKLNQILYDFAGYNFFGSVVNGATKTNEGMVFNGSNQYVNFPANLNFNYPEFTVEVWTKANSNSQSHVKNLIGKGNWNDLSDWYIGYRSGVYLSFVYGVEWWNGPFIPISQLNLTQWNHIVGVAKTNALELYVNGKLVSSVNITHGSVANSYPLQIANSSYYSNYYNGTISQIRLWKSARTADQIKDYAEKEVQPNEKDLVALWKFNQ